LKAAVRECLVCRHDELDLALERTERTQLTGGMLVSAAGRPLTGGQWREDNCLHKMIQVVAAETTDCHIVRCTRRGCSEAGQHMERPVVRNGRHDNRPV
jgi:hypothetical protein